MPLAQIAASIIFSGIQYLLAVEDRGRIGHRISQQRGISPCGVGPLQAHETGTLQRYGRPSNDASILVMACSSQGCDIRRVEEPRYGLTRQAIGAEVFLPEGSS